MYLCGFINVVIILVTSSYDTRLCLDVYLMNELNFLSPGNVPRWHHLSQTYDDTLGIETLQHFRFYIKKKRKKKLCCTQIRLHPVGISKKQKIISQFEFCCKGITVHFPNGENLLLFSFLCHIG